VGTRAQVTNIVNQRQVTGSNLTGVELSGLTRIELVFAFVLALTASAIALALGFAERRRTFAITAALGARGRQLGAFVWSESVFVTGLGALLGAGTAALLSIMLVDVLTGVFDPPPDALSIPWPYLAALAAALIVSVLAAGALTLRSLRRPSVDELRDL
jgi:putative ABC transport system permease protein